MLGFRSDELRPATQPECHGRLESAPGDRAVNNDTVGQGHLVAGWIVGRDYKNV
jgi:hypothetical protein